MGVFVLEVLGRMMMMMMMMMMVIVIFIIISSISLLLLCMKWRTTMSSLAALCTFHQQSRYVNGRWFQLLENRGAPIR